MKGLFTLCATTYLLIYAFEGAIRYALFNVGADSAILLRDALLIVPLLLLLIQQARRGKIHPAFLVFAVIVGVHGAISYLNLHTEVAAIYGTKLLVPVLFGFIAAQPLTEPSRKVLMLLVLVWIASIVGVVLDKFVYTYPWTGMETHIGGIQVDVSHGWDIDDAAAKRVAGFTRSSIGAATLLPILALLIAPRARSYIMRLLILAATVGAVALTTQKGAVVAIGAITACFAAPAFMRFRLLWLAAVTFAVVAVALPVFSAGLLLEDNGGVFSAASFAMRIMLTWPEAWQWIFNNEILPFGVGLGGIGGPQRFFAPNFFNPSDNMFIFLYANFGIFSLLYLGWMLHQAHAQPLETRAKAIIPLSLLVFILGYGAVLSMLEDQMSELFLGASVGMLWQLRQVVYVKPWAHAFSGLPMPVQAALDYQPGRAQQPGLEAS